MTIRVATVDDAAILAHHRATIWHEVSNWGVAPSLRKRGIARSLMDAILEFARAERLLQIVLHPSNEGRRLYESLGFEAADDMLVRLAP